MILEDSLADELKGLLIALYSICENGTFNCGLEDSDIISRLKISRATYFRHKKILIEKGYIIPFEGIYLLEDFNYSKCLEITCKWIGYPDESEIMDSQEQDYTRPSVLPDIFEFFFSKNK